jgi:hypothetical protein
MTAKPLFTFDWQLDKAAQQERGDIYDGDISGLFLRENRVALVSEPIIHHPGPADKAMLELSLNCMVQPHPESQFDWFSLVVNFRENPGVIIKIKDLTPREVKGTDPVKHTVKYGGGLTFEVGSVKLGPSATYETSNETLIYYPEVTGIGLNTSVATWNFSSATGAGVVIDRSLKLLLEVPTDLKQLRTRFIASGLVKRKSLLGKIPLLAQQEFTFDLFEDQAIH